MDIYIYIYRYLFIFIGEDATSAVPFASMGRGAAIRQRVGGDDRLPPFPPPKSKDGGDDRLPPFAQTYYVYLYLYSIYIYIYIYICLLCIFDEWGWGKGDINPHPPPSRGVGGHAGDSSVAAIRQRVVVGGHCPHPLTLEW
jgi:hypothetical protein